MQFPLKDWPLEITGSWMERLQPTFTQTTWLGWGLLLASIFFGLLVARTLSNFLRRTASSYEQKGVLIRATALNSLASPLALAILTVAINAGLGFIYMGEVAHGFFWRISAFLYVLAFGWGIYNWADVVESILRRLTNEEEGQLDDDIIRLIRKSFRIFFVIVFTLFTAQNIFGLNITGWLAGFGIAGLAISMAAQDSVKNIFGSLVIHFDKPFSVGDWIIFDGHEGYVEEIGFRSTRIRLWSRHQVTVPNMKFNSGDVTNVSRRPLDRRVMDITVTYDTPPEKVREAVTILEEILREPDVAASFDLKNYPFHIGFSDFNSASLNLRIYYYFIQHIDGRNYWSYFDHAHMVNMKILERFNAAGIDFAFPTQTLYLAGDPKRQLSVNFGQKDPLPNRLE